MVLTNQYTGQPHDVAIFSTRAKLCDRFMMTGFNTNERILMSVDAHIQQLEQRHQLLESELADLISSPSTSDAQLVDIKRRKLKLKDEIMRLRAAS